MRLPRQFLPLGALLVLGPLATPCAAAEGTAKGPRKGPAPDTLPAGALAQFGSRRLQDFTIDRSAAFSPDGKLLATSGANDPIRVWDVAGGKLARTYANHGSVYDLRWQPDGRLAALTFFGHDVFLMQAFGGDKPDPAGEEEQRIHEEALRRERRPAGEGNGRQNHLYHCFLSANGRKVVAVWNCGPKNNRRGAVYRFVSGQTSDTVKPEREVDLPSGYGVWLSCDGRWLLAHALPAADGGNRLCAFDLAAAGERKKPAWELAFPGREQDSIPDSCFSLDGKRVVVLFSDERVELWDGPNGKRLRELPRLPVYWHHGNGEWRGIDLSADGKRLALVARAATGEVGGRVVDVETGRDVCRLVPRPLPRSDGVVRFSADGKRVARAGGGVVGIWDATTGADACPLPGHRGVANSLAVRADGKRVVTAGADLTARAWDPATGAETWRAVLPQKAEVKFATPDGTVVLQEWARSAPRLSLGLDAASGKQRPLPGPLGQAKQDVLLACSPDGKQILTLDAEKAAFRLWSWPAGEPRWTAPVVLPRQLKLSGCYSARFTPDGKKFAAVVYYWDAAEQQAMRRVPDHPFVETWDAAAGRLLGRTELRTRDYPVLMPHPDGLFFWGQDGEVRNVASGRPLVKLRAPENRGVNLEWVRSAVLAPDGRTVAVGCGFNEQHLLLFETRTGRFREALPVPGRSVAGLAFLPDGRLVSLGATAMVWSVALRPQAAAPHDLAEEWERLGDPDPEKAWPAMRKLAAAPAEAVKLLGGRVRPVPKLSDETIPRIFRDLDADEFRVREEASAALDRLGPLAVARAKARLAERGSEEVKRRLTDFLAQYDQTALPAGELRALRAVEVLEAISTPAAGKLLGELAAGEPAASRTRDAAAALARLRRR